MSATINKKKKQDKIKQKNKIKNNSNVTRV